MLHAVVGLVLVIALALPAQAQERKPGPLTQPSGPYREQEFFIAWERQGKRWLSHAKIYRPEGEQKRPLIVLAHGSPRSEHDRPKSVPGWADPQARWFAAQGFVVVAPLRRGYGKSDGPWSEGYKSCNDADFWNAGLSTANEIQGILAQMAKEPYVDATRVVVVGQSAGGWGALGIASRNPTGIVGVINFAGGRGNTSPGTTCSPNRLIEAAGRYGSSAKVPALWVYTTNDKFFTEDLQRNLLRAYTSGGAPADYKNVGAFGADGHGLFADPSSMGRWTPLATDFLRKLELMR